MWVFRLDADEFLDEANRKKLWRLLASLPDEQVAYVMTQRSLLPSGWASRGPQVRLFRENPVAHTAGSPSVRWECRVRSGQALALVRRQEQVRCPGERSLLFLER